MAGTINIVEQMCNKSNEENFNGKYLDLIGKKKFDQNQPDFSFPTVQNLECVNSFRYLSL